MTPNSPTLKDLGYQLQACRNLESLLLAGGHLADAAHFRRRAAAVQKQINRQSTIRPRQ